MQRIYHDRQSSSGARFHELRRRTNGIDEWKSCTKKRSKLLLDHRYQGGRRYGVDKEIWWRPVYLARACRDKFAEVGKFPLLIIY
jgi:hypothetical protein